ncbi:MAG TPA: hypothetical protein VFH73_22515 [Polyangia bacterium]|nr:hypothetical protein [Polyangia bacterium]
MLQLAYPATQAGGVHVPPEQLDVAFAKTHDLLQAPQSLDVLSGVSQPGWGLQSPKPALQPPITQAPFTQAPSAFA